MKHMYLNLIGIIFWLASNSQDKITINDLEEISKSHFGFVQKSGLINQAYGDINCISSRDNLYEFNVGCGRGGDIIVVKVKPNSNRFNTFDLLIQKDDIYYGSYSASEKKVGELIFISRSEIRGYIKLCLEKNAACCGEEGEKFIMKKIK